MEAENQSVINLRHKSRPIKLDQPQQLGLNLLLLHLSLGQAWNVLHQNQPIKCFFDLLGSCFSNRPNWNMQWIFECLLILINDQVKSQYASKLFSFKPKLNFLPISINDTVSSKVLKSKNKDSGTTQGSHEPKPFIPGGGGDGIEGSRLPWWRCLEPLASIAHVNPNRQPQQPRRQPQ